jgi:hypothetical protein
MIATLTLLSQLAAPAAAAPCVTARAWALPLLFPVP